MRIFNTLIAVILLAGCVSTPAERAARAEREVAQMIQVYGPACTKAWLSRRIGYLAGLRSAIGSPR